MLPQILISVGFLLACGLVLATLLLLAEKKILNYGTCQIDVNAGRKTLAVEGGASLLASLAEHNVFIPSACGGRGTCAYCKVKVLDGGGQVSPIEAPYLTPEERQDQVRLSCQVKVRKDLKIDIPAELFNVVRFRARLAHKRPLTHDIVELRLELLDPSAITFDAGQYVQLESPDYKGRESVMRGYSISSRPADTHLIELIIRRVPDGICTTWVFDHLQEGQEVVFSGPYGFFHLNDSQAPIICIAGGSGMAPIWSLIRDMRDKGIARPATYFFGALTQRDLFFRDEFKQIEQECPWLHFVPALSQEPADSDWTGERGLITEVVARHFPDASQHEAYLCGSPGMIDASIAVLTQNGMPQENVFYDKF
ncbi:MAG: 2Fe-2S iron-sulfur cluster binding domain-containing protein [Kiritimatiellae bacterium]|nr:2Fe-2S iron-sulfur cluster binding domain-containing protein [Kiritimatiellia bacterium]